MYNFINDINFYDNMHIFHLIRLTHTQMCVCVHLHSMFLQFLWALYLRLIY